MASNITALQALEAYVQSNNEFVSRFGEVTQETFNQWANGVVTIPEVRNSFCQYLIDKIGRTYVNAMIAYNPLSFLRGEDLPFGSTIEDIWVELARGQQFDPEGKETLDRKLPDVKVLYYQVNTDLTYKVSVSDKELKLAFFREGQMGALIDRIVASLYEGARHDMLVLTKQLMAGYDGWYLVNVPAFDNTEATAKSVGKAIKSALLYSRFDNNAYNAAGVMNNIPEGEGLLIMTVAASIAIDFDYLANVFNLSKADLQARTVILDNINGMTDAVVLYCDRRFFQIHYLYESVESQRNTEGRFTNYTLCEEAIYAVAKYMTAIAFTTATTVEVKFNANGGEGTMPTRYAKAGKAFSLPFNSFVAPEGKVFAGWGDTAATAANATHGEITDVTIPAGTTAAQTYYAIWKAKS